MNPKIYRCFIASPSDTEKERIACEEVFNGINKSLGKAYNFVIESLKWEDDIFPSIGEDGQDVINKQIEGNYDLFLGIMFTRFGSKTKRAESGTVEEFDNAYKLATCENGKKVDNIFFYFNKANPKIDVDTKQLEKVKCFKKNVVSRCGLYKEYKGIKDFTETLFNDLCLYFNHLYSPVREKYNEIHESRKTTNECGFTNIFIHTILTIIDDEHYTYEVFRTVKIESDLIELPMYPVFPKICSVELHSDLVDLPPRMETDDNGQLNIAYPLPSNCKGKEVTIHYKAEIKGKCAGFYSMTCQNESLHEFHDVIINNDETISSGRLYEKELHTSEETNGKLIDEIPFDSDNKLFRVVLREPKKNKKYILRW